MNFTEIIDGDPTMCTSERLHDRDAAERRRMRYQPALVSTFFALSAACSILSFQGCKGSNTRQYSSPHPSAVEDAIKGRGPLWKYDAQRAGDLIRDEIIHNQIRLTPYANTLGFHVKKNSHGNYTVQPAYGIEPDLMKEYDVFRSPSHECLDSQTVGFNFPESIILWNDDEAHVAVLTYCVDSANGDVVYNNDASMRMTIIGDRSTPDAIPASNMVRRRQTASNPADLPRQQAPQTMDPTELSGMPSLSKHSTRIKLPADVAASLLIQKTAPVYPPIAQAARVSGTVIMNVGVSEAGIVQDVQVVSGPAMLQQSAINTVRAWRYKPFIIDTTPTGFETTVNVVFSLGG